MSVDIASYRFLVHKQISNLQNTNTSLVLNDKQSKATSTWHTRMYMYVHRKPNVGTSPSDTEQGKERVICQQVVTMTTLHSTESSGYNDIITHKTE